MKLLLASATAATALALPGTVCAHAVYSASTQPTLSTERSLAPVDGVGLEEIVVTAQKHSETPQAVLIASDLRWWRL